MGRKFRGRGTGQARPSQGTRRNDVPIGLNVCSLCEGVHLTIGEQKHGGIRYCLDCLKKTFGWSQLGKERRERLEEFVGAMLAREDIQEELRKSREEVTPEVAKAYALGEAKKRLYESGDL